MIHIPLFLNDISGSEIIVILLFILITTYINIKNILTEKQEELLAPMDQIYSEIENTIHYESNTGNKEPIQAVEEIKEKSELLENKENTITNSNEVNSNNNDSNSDNNG